MCVIRVIEHSQGIASLVALNMFKLVRIDDEYHSEIVLKDGKQVIGRDQMFECDDKRISRRHAELEAMVDSVCIKALHTNPCFFVKHNMAVAQILKQNTAINGCHGDKTWLSTKQPMILASSKEDTVKEECKELTSADNSTDQDKEIAESLTDRQTEAPDSPSLSSKDNVDELTQEYQPCKPTVQSPSKRCLIKQEPSSPDVKKVKIERDSDDTKAQCSSGLPSSSGDSSNAGDSSPPPAVPQNTNTKRERCMYGKDCYRRNPQHKARFSHPADADWGAGAQAECPYGYACARRDPRHWRDHSHPYGMHPPPPQGIKKKRSHIVQRNGNIFYINANTVNFYDDHFEAEDTDGESRKRKRAKVAEVQGPIVQGKRARRPLAPPGGAWSGTESDEDPYGTDDSEEWSPPSDLSESQDYSQTV
ncbi:unnamed protein product, partial [Iphiclides podalirius]